MGGAFQMSGWQAVLSGKGGRISSSLCLIVAIALAPQPTDAQTYSMEMGPVAYEVMPPGGFPGGDPAVILTTSSWGGTVAPFKVDLPFTFNFYGLPYDSMHVNSAGLVTFGPDHPTLGIAFDKPPWNPPWTIDNPEATNNMIAMWAWNLVCANSTTTGRVQTQVLGSPPNRQFVVDYPNCRGFNLSSTTRFKFQLWLTEGSDDFEVRYGPDPGPGVSTTDGSHVRAMVGVRNADGTDFTPGPCPGSCYSADFPEEMAIRYSAGAQVKISGIQAPVEGFAGIAFPISYTMMNSGSKPAENFTVQYWVSPEPSITGLSTSMGYDSRTWSLQPKDAVVVHAEPRLPIELEEGEFYLIVEADPHHVVDISNRAGTMTVYGPFTNGLRAPNLAVGWVDAPEVVTPGSTFEVPWLAQNTGNLGTFQIPYRLVLSRSRSVSPLSVTIGEGIIPSMDLLDELEMNTEVTIPFDLDPGMYFIGAQLDPDRVVFEHERRDNTGMSNVVLVWDQGLVVLTQDLPVAHFQGHYSVRLMAYGGDGHASWSVKPGSILPPGMSIAVETSDGGEVATFLRGIPSKKGLFPFTLEVRSGEHVEEQQFSLEVSAGEHALSVMTQSLAEAAFGFEYVDWLSGLGGLPPYNWEVANGSLPQGIFLRGDGLLSGRPEEDGHFNVTFRLTDSQGLQTTRELVLNVTAPSALTCVTKELPRLKLGEAMRPVPLLAAGGVKTETGAYIWDSVSTVRQVTTIGEVSMSIEEGLPPGLRLEQGSVQGTPNQGGTYTWTVKVTDTVGATQDCPIRVDVERDHGITVATRSLPLAVAGRSYRAKIEVLGGDGLHQYSELEPGRTLADLGLSFDENGFLTGTPSLDLLEGESEREYSFTVRVQDVKNRIGIGALTIRLHAKGFETPGALGEEQASVGCQVGSDGAGFWLAALLGLAALAQRRRRGA